MSEHIHIDGKRFRKFIPYPAIVRDGTVRCIFCGQIDEPPYHDDNLCPPLSRNSEGREP